MASSYKLELESPNSQSLLAISPVQWLIIVLLIPVAFALKTAYFSPLRQIPGPFLAKFTKIWLAWHAYKGDSHEILLQLHQNHGDRIRIGPNEISTISTEDVAKVYSINSGFVKSNFYAPSHGTRNFDLFAGMDEKVHSAQRRVVNHAYSTQSMKELEPFIDAVVLKFIGALKGRNEQVLDLGMWLQLVAFDFIGEVTFSRTFELIEEGREPDVFQAIHGITRSTAWVGQIPWVYKIESLLKPYLGEILGSSGRNGSMRDFTLKLVKARAAAGGNPKDMMAKFEAISKAKPEQFGPMDVVSQTSTNVIAGSDTTAITMRAVVYYVLKNPTVRKQLVEEVDQYYATVNSAVLTFDAANQMPYLQAVMYEAMRLHPAVGQTLPRVVPREGMTCDGNRLPPGTVIGSSSYVLGRSKKVFGQDADSFHPERWMGPNKVELQKFWLAFGAGSRTCIGNHLAWIEMTKLLAATFRHFELRLADENAALDVKCWFLLIQKGLNVVLKQREL